MTFIDARPYRRGDGDFSDEESEPNLSFDLTDLPESPLSFEPETPPDTLLYTHGERCEFANDWSHPPQHAPPPPHQMLHASLASIDDACTRALSFSRHCVPGGCSRQPLHALCNEYASAKDLLNAFSSTTPPWTPEGTTPRFWGDTMPNMKLTASDYDFNYETNSLLPLTCSQMFETQVTTVIPQTRSANRASIEGGSSRPHVRSLTDDISKKLSDDLSSKLAQRRAWENDQQTDGNIKPCLINEGGINYCSSPNSSQELKRKNNTILNSSASRTRMTSDTITNHSSSASRIIQHERTSAPVVSHSVKAHILEAKRLGGRRYSGLPDPSCWISLHCRSKVVRDADAGAGNSGGEVSLMDMKAQHTMQPHFKSPAVKQAQDPTWNSSVSLNNAYRSFSVMVDGFEHRSARSEALGGEPINLFLTVHDGGEMKNNFLGQAAILDICPSSVVDRWVTLQRRDGMPQIDSLGRVSSVRIKVEYSSSHAHMPPIQHYSPDDTLTTAAIRHGSARKAQQGIRWNPYRQPTEEHHVSAQILQSSARRMLANQTLRFKLLHARLLQSDADDDKTRRRKMEVSSSNYSLVRYGHASAHSPIVTRSSDYEIGSVSRTPIVLRSSDYFEIGSVANGNGQDEIQKSGQGSIIHPNFSPQVQQLQMRESDCMMDQALRNRNSLGQVEALLNLGLGLLDKGDCKEQGHKYLNESWRLLENMKTADLHHDRAYSILQRMTQCGAFKDKPDLITQLHNLAGLRRMSPPPQRARADSGHPSIIESRRQVQESIPPLPPRQQKEHERDSSSWNVTRAPVSKIGTLFEEYKMESPEEYKMKKESDVSNPEELEKIYRRLTANSEIPQTYRELRRLPAGEAAQVVRRKMSLSPVRSRQSTVPTANRTQRIRDSVSDPVVNILDRYRSAEYVNIDDSDDENSGVNANRDNANRGANRVGQIALSKLINSCDEFVKTTNRESARQPPENTRTLADSYQAMAKKKHEHLSSPTIRTVRDSLSSTVRAQTVEAKLPSRLMTLEAQLRALDAL